MRALPLLLLCCAPVPLAAQLPSDECVDRAGRPVRSIVRNDMPWAGAATELNGESVIYWNQSRNARASLATRLFIYMHECAHHTLGHVWKAQGPEWEAEADCWAVQTLWERGALRRRGMRELEREVRRRSRIRGLVGSSGSLYDCIAIKTDRAAWRRSLTALAAASEDSFASAIGQAVPRPSARSGVHESLLDVPGTYDCEVLSSRDLRCEVFTGATERATAGRYRALAGIIRGWLPAGWSAEDIEPSPWVLRSLVVSDTVGRRLTLSATRRSRVVLVVHPVPRDSDDVLPPERMYYRLSYLTPACAGRPFPGDPMRLSPQVLLLTTAAFAAGCGDPAPPGDSAGSGSPASAPAAPPGTAAGSASAAGGLRDPVQLAVEAEIDGRTYRANGAGECQQTGDASIYSVPAAMWRASYDGRGTGELAHLNLTLWQPNAGGAMQANLALQVGERTHRIATVTGGTLEGSATATAAMDGAAGTLRVSGRDADGNAVNVSVRCERMTVPVAEGG